MNTPEEIFAAGRLLARMKAPYFRAILLGLAVVEAPGLGTIGVTEHGVLLWDRTFVARVTPEEMAGLLVHEVMHVCLKHGARGRRAGRDAALDNQAADLAINPAVIDMGCQLPGGELKGLFPEDFGFARGLTADEYYELLRKRACEKPGKGGRGGQHGKGNAGVGGQGTPDEANDAAGDGGSGGDADHAKPGKGQAKAGAAPTDKPHAAGGWCGSCAGRAVPNEPGEQAAASRSEAEVERMARQVAEAVREHASSGRGTVPGALARWADTMLKPSKIPWHVKLARLTRAACTWREGAVDHRYDAPGRRQAGLGYGPGRPILPRLRMPVPNVALIIDTSGSMGSAELVQAAVETKAVLRALNASVTLCTCDAAVHGLRKVRGIEEALGMLRGGGGTDMRPAFAELELRTRPRPDVVICITDGLVGDGVPAHAPRGMKVVWVLVGPYRRVPAAWGECVEVDGPKAEEDTAA